MAHVVDGHGVTRGTGALRLVTSTPSDETATPRTPVVPAAVSRSRRIPVEALALTTAAVVAAGAARQTLPLVLLAALVVALVPVATHVRPAGCKPGTVLASTTRGVLIPVGALALGLHVLNAGHRVVDDVLLLGVVGAAAAGLAAAVASRRLTPPRVVVVGDLPQVRGMVARWIDERSVDVVGGLAVGSASGVAEAGLADLGIVCVPSLDDVAEHAALHEADLVIVTPGPAVSPLDVRRLTWALQSSPVRLAVIGATEHIAPHRVGPESIAGSTMSVLAPPRAPRPSAVVKGAADRVLAALALVIVAPLLVVLSLAIRLDSRGRALFTQVRVGRDGRLFTVYKLRTMTVDAEDRKAGLRALDEGNGVLFKIREDPRITRVGRLLRSTSLDELPQLLNVLKGDMSLVGPRPALPEEVAVYTELERRRLVVKPGITGLWQVSGRSSLGRDRSMHLDSSYADDWRLRGDLLILLRTVGAVVSRRGAY